MTGNLTLALTIGALYTVGTYLLLQRTLTRIVIGLGLLAHPVVLDATATRGAQCMAPRHHTTGHRFILEDGTEVDVPLGDRGL